VSAPPSSYQAGVSVSGQKVHAVAPGTVVRNPLTFAREARSLCGEDVVAVPREHFDPDNEAACWRCVSSVRLLRGPGA
jgi:hypothetical protein